MILEGMKKPRRVPTEFLGAFKSGHRKGVREYIDDDLSYELLAKAERGCEKSREALAWLTKFNNETYRGVLKKDDPEALHSTPELYKSATDGHNARRRDTTNILKAAAVTTGGLFYFDGLEVPDNENHPLDTYALSSRSLDHEDTLLDMISPKAKRKASDAFNRPLPKRLRKSGGSEK